MNQTRNIYIKLDVNRGWYSANLYLGTSTNYMGIFGGGKTSYLDAVDGMYTKLQGILLRGNMGKYTDEEWDLMKALIDKHFDDDRLHADVAVIYILPNANLLADYARSCINFMQLFCIKHNFKFDKDAWVGNRVGQMALIDDMVVSMEDMTTDILEDAMPGDYRRYYDEIKADGAKFKYVNYHSWLGGCPLTEIKAADATPTNGY